MLQTITGLIVNRPEVLVIFVVIGIVFMMILPLPTFLVDGLIALNISMSALMVVLVMYMPGPLAFATFPALLLITTMFRMALSITTTRLILLQGDAGQIVEAFGDFVVGGNLVVGLVIFLILTIVNFMVITKGAERVAEVAARFTLDAMPGKQMSIDGDLRAGLINAVQAQKKRADISKESQLFGAMDGAMKFVKGDAIAGIIIVMVNILGGFSIGVAQLGLPAGEAIKLYSTLTIGDGLVAQIPALLISITAALIITRVSNSNKEDENVGAQMASELSSEPKAWVIASIVLVGFSLIPGMPFFTFIFFALVFAAIGGYRIMARNKIVEQHVNEQENTVDEHETRVSNNEADDKSIEPYDKLMLCVAPGTNMQSFSQVLKSIRTARNNVVQRKGYTIAGIELHEMSYIEPGCFEVMVHGVSKLSGCNDIFDKIIAKKDLDENQEKALLSSENIDKGIVQEKGKFIWVNSVECDASLIGTLTMDAKQYLVVHAKRMFLEEAHQFFGIEEVSVIIQWLDLESTKLAQELQQIVPLPQISDIFKRITRDEISIRSLRRIAELIIEAATQGRSIDDIVQHVRLGLSEQMCTEYATDYALNIFLLDPDLESLMRKHLKKHGNEIYIELPLDNLHQVKKAISKTNKHVTIDSRKTIPLIVPHDLRLAVRHFLRRDYGYIPVLSSAELPRSLDINTSEVLSI